MTAAVVLVKMKKMVQMNRGYIGDLCFTMLLTKYSRMSKSL